MAVKGQTSKENLIKELLEYFGDRAFRYDKDLRVNCTEDGQLCQIKLNFTVSKVAVNAGDDNAIPTVAVAPSRTPAVSFATTPATQEVPQPTAEEKQNISDLLKSLGL